LIFVSNYNLKKCKLCPVNLCKPCPFTNIKKICVNLKMVLFYALVNLKIRILEPKKIQKQNTITKLEL